MTPQELRDRTTTFAVRVSRFARPLVAGAAARHAALQLTRAAAGVAANYRAAGLARSHAEFGARISVVLEEADETVFWLEFLVEADLAGAVDVGPLLDEVRQLTAIFGASKRTTQRRREITRGRRR